MIKKWHILLITFIFSTLLIQAENIDIVTAEWKDYTNSDESGLYFDILREIYETAGYNLNIIIVPYERASRLVQEKKSDLMIGSYLDEIEGVIYPEMYFDADNVGAMFLKENLSLWNGESSLKNKKVTFIRGYELNEYLDVPIKVYEIDKKEIALKLLKAKRVDFHLDAISDLNFDFEVNNEFKSEDFVIKSLKSLPLYMVFKNDTKGMELKSVWDRRFKESINSGILEKIYEKWDSLKSYELIISKF